MNTFIHARCEKCGDKVSQRTAEWSMHKIGQIYCFDCNPKSFDVIKKYYGKQDGTTSKPS